MFVGFIQIDCIQYIYMLAAKSENSHEMRNTPVCWSVSNILFVSICI